MYSFFRAQKQGKTGIIASCVKRHKMRYWPTLRNLQSCHVWDGRKSVIGQRWEICYYTMYKMAQNALLANAEKFAIILYKCGMAQNELLANVEKFAGYCNEGVNCQTDSLLHSWGNVTYTQWNHICTYTQGRDSVLCCIPSCVKHSNQNKPTNKQTKNPFLIPKIKRFFVCLINNYAFNRSVHI